jgi:hypothetical protein
LGKVTPIIAPIEIVRTLFNKRSANLIIAQVPEKHIDPLTSLRDILTIGKHALRKGSKMLIVYPPTMHSSAEMLFEDGAWAALSVEEVGPNFRLLAFKE